jgi:putative NADH-flavin reductase
MRITIFGAAGGTGTRLLDLACAAGHEVTAVVRDPARLTGDDPHLTVVTANVRVVKPILRGLLRHPWADMRRMEDIVRDSDLDWTIMRPPMLTDGRGTGSYRTAVDRNVRGGIRVSRADLADGILRCLADPGSIHTAVSIAN